MTSKPHELTLNFIKDITTRESRIVNFLGQKIKINKDVFPVDSDFSYSSKMTAKRIPENPGNVLDVGTGTGVQAIIAAKRGAKSVLAIDIDKNSIKNAIENVKLNKLNSKIKIRESDLFNNIKPNEKFDLIISQLPFADVKYKSKVSHFLFDPGFNLHKRFLKDAKNHLTNKGKILIPSADIANEQELMNLINKYNYKIINLHAERFNGHTWKIYTLSKT